MNNQSDPPNQSNIPQESQPSFQPEPPKKFGLPRWASILIAAVAIIVVSLVSWAAYRSFVSAPTELPKESPEEKQVSPLPAAKEIAPADETANWKTYRNEEYRFEVKYPGNWKFEVLKSGFNNTGSDGFFISKDESRFGILPKGGWDYGLICAVSDGVIDGKPVKVKECDRNKVFLRIYHFIDFVPSFWLICEEELKSCNRLDLFAVDKENFDILNQILSTFKFIK